MESPVVPLFLSFLHFFSHIFWSEFPIYGVEQHNDWSDRFIEADMSVIEVRSTLSEGDKKIKRSDWQKSCTTLMAVRSQRSERSEITEIGEIEMCPKPLGEEIKRGGLAYFPSRFISTNTSQGNPLLPHWHDFQTHHSTKNCERHPGTRSSQT